MQNGMYGTKGVQQYVGFTGCTGYLGCPMVCGCSQGVQWYVGCKIVCTIHRVYNDMHDAQDVQVGYTRCRMVCTVQRVCNYMHNAMV